MLITLYKKTKMSKEKTIYSGMKIYHKEMAQALSNLFELAWEKAEIYDQTTKIK